MDSDVSKAEDKPAYAILYDDAALNSLKRPQLVALCREHGIKVVGKVSGRVQFT